jgi:Domain of unknown function (DUF6457)
MSVEPYDAVVARVTASTTAHALGRDEADALLWLAKTVADAAGDRRAAPLTCYLAGQAVAGEPDDRVRIARILALADELGAPGE